jgi:hypothetical protein
VAGWMKEKGYNNFQFYASDINFDAANLTRKVSNHFNVHLTF